VGVLAAAAALAWHWLLSGPRVPPACVLCVDLRAELPEHRGDSVVEQLLGADLDVSGLHALLGRAALDPRVRGVFLRVGRAPCGFARVEEVRGLLDGFRRARKPVLALAEGPDSLGYLLATAADEVLLDRGSSVDLTGLRLTAFFVKNFLDRLGVRADLVRIGEYKGMYEQLTASSPSAEFHDAAGGLVEALFAVLVEEIARARGLRESRVRDLVDQAPIAPQVALEESLVDRLVWGDELAASLDAAFGAGVEVLDATTYLKAVRRESPAAVRFALIHVQGMIVEGPGGWLPVVGHATGAVTVVRALEAAETDGSVAGVLLRIDSPGGSLAASERIWRQVDRTAAVKPVVAALGDQAASGAYYAACAADWLVARPGSFVGSIGVFGGKVVLDQFLAENGVRVASFSRGERAGMHDILRPYSPEERRALEEDLESRYRDFVARVAKGRRRTCEEVDRLARGRIWSGRQALEVGLVDELGGLDAALAKLRELSGLDAGEEVALFELPEPQSLWDLFRREPRREIVSAVRGAWSASQLDEWLRVLRQETGILSGTTAFALEALFTQVR
jgi:protease-4